VTAQTGQTAWLLDSADPTQETRERSMLPDEVWKPSLRFPRYHASTLGRIRNAETGHVLKPYRMRNGYLQVNLCGKTVTAHTIVLEAFSGPRPKGYQASHLNGDRADNHAENLVWETATENNRRKALHGTQPAGDTHPCSRKTHCKHGHEFTPENTYRSRRQRHCRTCTRLRMRAVRQVPANRERHAADMRARRTEKAAEQRGAAG
jgi:hypothetical protein